MLSASSDGKLADALARAKEGEANGVFAQYNPTVTCEQNTSTEAHAH